AKLEIESQKSGLCRQAKVYVAGRGVLVTSRHFSPVTLELSDLVSPGARQAKSSEGS
ncbi:hypothetical protein A2U01_0098500, partial [Trifolium medium]|nr:hypothetical protein [Trifolium medium]